MATNGAFTIGASLVHAAFPESGGIAKHGPGKFEQEPLAKAFGNKFSKKNKIKNKMSKEISFLSNIKNIGIS